MAKPRPHVAIHPTKYAQMQRKAAREGITIARIVDDALRLHLGSDWIGTEVDQAEERARVREPRQPSMASDDFPKPVTAVTDHKPARSFTDAQIAQLAEASGNTEEQIRYLISVGTIK